MAGNNWVYLPKVQEYVNLNYLTTLRYTYEDRWVATWQDLSQAEFRDKDAEVLRAALRKLVTDDK